MEHYIQAYRDAGYTGFIQVLEIITKRKTWLYDSSLTLSQDIVKNAGGLPKQLSVGHRIDDERGLDITQIFCDGSENSRDAKSHDEQIARSNEAYYQSVRRYIGNSELFSCGACGIIENNKRQYAIARRSDTGEWGLPAGSKELGESIEQTIEQESMEELGIKIERPMLIAITSGKQFQFTYPNGHQVKWVSFLYYAKHRNGALRVNDSENTQAMWADEHEVIKLLSARFSNRFELYKRHAGSCIII